MASSSDAAARRQRAAAPTRKWEDDEEEWMQNTLVSLGGVGNHGVSWAQVTDLYNATWQNVPIVRQGVTVVLTRGRRTSDSLQQRFAPWYNSIRPQLARYTNPQQPSLNLSWRACYQQWLAAQPDSDEEEATDESSIDSGEDPAGDLDEMMRRHEQGL